MTAFITSGMFNGMPPFRRSVRAAIMITTLFSVNADGNTETNNPFPPEDAPVSFTELVTGKLPEGLSDANEEAFESGLTGTADDAEIENVLSRELLREGVTTFIVPAMAIPAPHLVQNRLPKIYCA